MKMINYEEKGQVFWRVKSSQYDQVIYNECNKSKALSAHVMLKPLDIQLSVLVIICTHVKNK